MADEASATGNVDDVVEVADTDGNDIIDVTALESLVHEGSRQRLTPQTIIPKRDKRGRKRKRSAARKLSAEEATETQKKSVPP